MRYFFSTGEASGELAATLLAREIVKLDPEAQFAGIGAGRMREAGFAVFRDHTGWASLGPFSAIVRIPKLLAQLFATAAHLRRTKPDLVVLVDFGAFNVRLAQLLRRTGFAGPVLDWFPPSAWLDREGAARAVSAVATPLSAFAHQRDFYASLGLKAAYFGHPLAAQYVQRAPRAAPPQDAGTIALLPGSRQGELRHHVPLLVQTFQTLQRSRPHVRGVFGAASDAIAASLRSAVEAAGINGIDIVRGAETATERADAAFVASGTAVLECALRGVPSIAFYVASAALARYFRRVYRGAYITIPNLVLGRQAVPEFLQERATPQALAEAMDRLLQDPQQQLNELEPLREALGPPDALQRCAAFAVELASRRC